MVMLIAAPLLDELDELEDEELEDEELELDEPLLEPDESLLPPPQATSPATASAITEALAIFGQISVISNFFSKEKKWRLK